MKLLVCFSAFCVLIICSGCEIQNVLKKSKNYSNLADSVNKVLNNFFSKETSHTDLVTPEHISSSLSNDFSAELLTNSFFEARIAFRQYSSLSPDMWSTYHRHKEYGIFLVESFNDFMEIHTNLEQKIFDFVGFYLIVLLSGEIPEIEKIFILLWEIQIHNVIIMFEDKNNAVLIKTFIPFNSENCYHTEPVLVDEFTNGTFRNELENVYSDKMKNLYKCPIRVAVSNNDKPYVIVKPLPNQSYLLSGLSIRVIETLSQVLNFEINFTYVGPEGFFYENGTAEGPLKVVMDGEADLTISNWWLKVNRLKFLDASRSYRSEALCFIVPPGKEYTAFEKLAIPFSFTVWILILSFGIIGVAVISITQCLSKTLQNFVFGTGVRHPCMNMFIGTIGGSQNVLPRRNFARFLLMMLLLYSLVLRTLYQGLYYQFLRSNNQHKRVETVEEMAENGFTFFVYNGVEELLIGSEVIKNRNRFVE